MKALSADPNHANVLVNFVQFLIGRGRFSEAIPLSNRAWARIMKRNETDVGEAAFSRWLIAATSGRDGQPALGRLKSLLQAGFVRSPWSFDAMLSACIPKLTDEQGKLAGKLAAALLDESKLAELDADPLWQQVQAIPLDAPWPDEPVT